jgi:hypothetical protein
MDPTCAADRFVAGLFVGAGVAWLISLVTGYYASFLPPWATAHPLTYLALQMIAAAGVIVRPCLLRTVLADRRNPFLLNEDLEAMILGRAVGAVAGLLLGVALNAQLL